MINVTFNLDVVQNGSIIREHSMRGRAEAARQAHNLKVIGSNPIPATRWGNMPHRFTNARLKSGVFFLFSSITHDDITTPVPSFIKILLVYDYLPKFFQSAYINSPGG